MTCIFSLHVHVYTCPVLGCYGMTVSYASILSSLIPSLLPSLSPSLPPSLPLSPHYSFPPSLPLSPHYSFPPSSLQGLYQHFLVYLPLITPPTITMATPAGTAYMLNSPVCDVEMFALLCIDLSLLSCLGSQGLNPTQGSRTAFGFN